MGLRALRLLERADWLTAARVRSHAIVLGLAALVLLANSFLKAMGPDGTDFLAFWGAGLATAGGDPASAYDLAVQEQVQTATGSSGWFAFVNPPPFLFLAAPFGLLPFALSWIAWVGLTWLAWAWATNRAFPGLDRLVVALFPGALLAAGHAQTGLLTGALLVGGAVLLDRRPLVAGALLGALVIKPHLALLVPLWLATGGRWRAFLAAAASAVGLLIASWAVFGPAAMLAYTQSWRASAAILETAGPDLYLRMASIYAQLSLVLPRFVALAVHCVLALAAAGLVVTARRRFANDTMAMGALALAATALASPYLFNYDLPFLVLPLLWLVQRGRETGFRRFEKLALVALWCAPYATRAAALPLGVNLMPLASIWLLWLVWTRGVAEKSRMRRSTTYEPLSSEQGGNLAAKRALRAAERHDNRGTTYVEPQLSQFSPGPLDAASRLS